MLRWLVFAFLLLPTIPALAEKRVALVISVSNYQHVRSLKNPANDAMVLKAALENLQFQVTIETDRDLRRTRRALEDFRADAAGADVALVYFAGHGAELSGDNRLLPADADTSSLAAFKTTTLSLEEVRETVTAVGKIGLIVLDACRNDPFGVQSNNGRSAISIAPDVVKLAKPGLGRMGRAENVLFAFAAAPGQTADDGPDDHSPFTGALTKFLGTTGLEIRSVMTLVQQEVYDRSGGRQLPYVESGLPVLFFASGSGDVLPEREKLLLAMAELTPETRSVVERISARTQTPMAPLFAAYLEADLGQSPSGELETRLMQAANDFKALQEQVRRATASDPLVKNLRASAAEQLSLGSFDTARALLEEAAKSDGDARAQMKDNFVARTISEAETLLLSGQASHARLRDDLAVEDFNRALSVSRDIELSLTRDLRIRIYSSLSSAQFGLGRGPEVVIALRNRQQIADQISSADPADEISMLRSVDYRQELARAQSNVADYKSAIDTLKEIEVVIHRDVSEQKSIPLLHRFTATYRQIGNFWRQGGYCSNARDALEKALVISDKTQSVVPNDRRTLELALRIHLELRGLVDDATPHIAAARSIETQLSKTGPSLTTNKFLSADGGFAKCKPRSKPLRHPLYGNARF